MRGSLQHALDLLQSKGVNNRKILRYLEQTCIVPVLTAHPTEVQRKSTLDLHRAISRQLALGDTIQTSSAQQQMQRTIAGLVATPWQTRMLPRQKLTVRAQIDN